MSPSHYANHRAAISLHFRTAILRLFHLVTFLGLAAVVVNCAAQDSAESSSVVVQERELSLLEAASVQGGYALDPRVEPEGTVRVLYEYSGFFRARNAAPFPMLQRFLCCFTPGLVKHFESHNDEVRLWRESHANENLKLPIPAGPIFISNYEGADDFSVGTARVDGVNAEVPVSLSYSEGGETIRWTDIAILQLVNGIWLLDDIRFDPEAWEDYTLRMRVTLGE